MSEVLPPTADVEIDAAMYAQENSSWKDCHSCNGKENGLEMGYLKGHASRDAEVEELKSYAESRDKIHLQLSKHTCELEEEIQRLKDALGKARKALKLNENSITYAYVKNWNAESLKVLVYECSEKNKEALTAIDKALEEKS